MATSSAIFCHSSARSNERRAQALSRPITATMGDSQPSQEVCPRPGGTLGCPHRQVIHTGVPVVENVREKIREVNEKSACKKVGSPDPTGAAVRMIAMCQYLPSVSPLGISCGRFTGAHVRTRRFLALGICWLLPANRLGPEW